MCGGHVRQEMLRKTLFLTSNRVASMCALFSALILWFCARNPLGALQPATLLPHTASILSLSLSLGRRRTASRSAPTSARSLAPDTSPMATAERLCDLSWAANVTSGEFSVYSTPLDHSLAESYCVNTGGHLARVTSWEENLVVYDLAAPVGACWLGSRGDSTQEASWNP